MRIPALAVAFSLGVSLAMAGPIADFNAEMASSYAKYRMVLFKTNQDDQAASAKLGADFAASWAALAGKWRSAPPPQYSEDAGWGATVDEVSGLIARASEEIGAGNLADAHETLERVRDAVSALHARNGVIAYSDRMNDYHAYMEKVLGTDYADAGAARATADAGVLAYLAARLKDDAPSELAEDREFNAAIDAIAASVGEFAAAGVSGDAASIQAAQGKLKKPYAMAFVKYG